MPKPGKQAEGKRRKQLVDMSSEPEAPSRWIPPDPDECEEFADYRMTPTGGTPGVDEIRVRMVEHVATSALVDFAIIQRTLHRGKWREVAKADSSHDDEVHVHQFGRRSGEEVGGGTELIHPIKCEQDVADGYDVAYVRIVDNWEDNKRRWHDA